MILKSNEIKKIEKILNYEFNNKELLEQAFIRESYAKEKRILGEKVYGNEQLEFFGDGVLKYILIKNFEERFCSIESGKLFSMNNEDTISNFVSHFSDKQMLSDRIERLGLHNYLILNKGDQLQNAKNSINVKEDLFEALVGAIWIDCDKNITSMENIILNMLNLKVYVIQNYNDAKSKLFLWAKKKCIRIYLEPTKKEDMFYVKCKLDNYNYITVGEGKKIKTAEKNACQKMLKLLQENNLYEEDLVGEFDFDSAINKLQELSQKNIIGEIKYDYQYNYDENMWVTKCSISNFDYLFIGKDKSKTISKKKIAYDILCKISNEMDFERLSLYKKDKVFMILGDNYEEYDILVGYILEKNDKFVKYISANNDVIIQTEISGFNNTCVFMSLLDALVAYFRIKYYYLYPFDIDENIIKNYFIQKFDETELNFIDDVDKLTYYKKMVDELDYEECMEKISENLL